MEQLQEIKLTKYQKNKTAIMKWRQNHKDEFYESNLPHLKKWIDNNREQYRELCRLRQQRFQTWKRVSKIYMNILLYRKIKI
jgi:hypothetical protein